ncbi:MAG: CHAD domain-containing protein [Burkholderiales bacterium]|nr:CHAD domain-containing protein [Burkholderiales bacterium]
MNVEIELKLRVPANSVARLHRHPLLKSANPAHTAKLTSMYYDTPSLDLKSRGIALRLRKAGKRWIQTIKGGGGALAGVHTRYEWEIPVARNALDFTKLDDPFLIEIFGSSELRQNLSQVFVTEFTRKTVPVEFGGSLIEYCLDKGTIISGDKTEAILEAELELKSGDPSKLYEFALELQKSVPLILEGRSKAERGYALFLGGHINRVKKAVTCELHRKMDVAAACREIVRGCLLQLQDNTLGYLDRETDPEYLHQMRVGLRRMRSAFSIFSHVFGKTAFSDIVPELRWLAGELGPARNWDVFALETLPPIIDALSPACDFVKLRQAGDASRMKSQERAVLAIESHRFQVLLLELGAGLSRDSWPQSNAASIADFANQILEKRYRNFERRGRGIATLCAAELHALRIDGKKLRYAAEFFSPLYSARAASAFLAVMASLQDALGAINDAATTNHLLEELSEVDPCAPNLVKGWAACESRQRIGQLGREWKAFKTIVPFWK